MGGGGSIAWADGTITISSTFSDAALIQVIKKTLNKSDADTTLTQEELDSVTYLDCSNAGVKEIIGVDSFANLEILDLSGNTGLTTIATNTNTKLKSLDCSGCTDLSGLQVVRTGNYPSNENLQYLNCSNTALMSLNVTKCTELISLDCSNTKITNVTLTANTKLRSLKMNELGGTGALNLLDVTTCTELRELSFAAKPGAKNKISTLDLSKCTKLETLNCGRSNFTTLNLDNNTELRHLSCDNNSLTTLDVSKCTKLETLNCSNNSLTSLTLGENNTLTALDVSGCTALKTLDVSGHTKLNALTYSDGMTVTGYDLTVHARQVILDGSINMAFYVPISDTSVTKSAVFSGGAANGKFRSDLTITEGEAPNTTTYYAFVGEVKSIQMADPITAEITVGTKKITFAGYTVEKYLNTIGTDQNTYGSEAAVLANTLEAYGYYAQQTLSETNTSYGTHEAIQEPSSGYTVNASSEANNTYTAAFAMKILDEAGTNEVIENPPSVTCTLDLNSKTTLHVYLPNGSSLRNANGKTGIDTISTSSKTYTINSTKVTAENTTIDTTTYFDIAFSDIAAHELVDQFTIPVTINSTPYTIQISAMSYVDTVISKSNEQLNTAAGLNDTDTTNYPKAMHLKQAVLALYNYYLKTVLYRSTTNQ